MNLAFTSEIARDNLKRLVTEAMKIYILERNKNIENESSFPTTKLLIKRMSRKSHRDSLKKDYDPIKVFYDVMNSSEKKKNK